eukprot:s258_g25.t1
MGWRPVRKQGCRRSKGLLIRLVSPASRAEAHVSLQIHILVDIWSWTRWRQQYRDGRYNDHDPEAVTSPRACGRASCPNYWRISSVVLP